MKLAVDPSREHTEGVADEIDTARPEVAAADTAYVGPPTVAETGEREVNAIDCEPLPTVKDCWAWGAAS
jgi:hypothetical protein